MRAVQPPLGRAASLFVVLLSSVETYALVNTSEKEASAVRGTAASLVGPSPKSYLLTSPLTSNLTWSWDSEGSNFPFSSKRPSNLYLIS